MSKAEQLAAKIEALSPADQLRFAADVLDSLSGMAPNERQWSLVRIAQSTTRRVADNLELALRLEHEGPLT
jgi:hypothetical protein